MIGQPDRLPAVLLDGPADRSRNTHRIVPQWQTHGKTNPLPALPEGGLVPSHGPSAWPRGYLPPTSLS